MFGDVPRRIAFRCYDYRRNVFGIVAQNRHGIFLFLAIPTMFGATCYDLYKNWNILNTDDFLAFAVGFIASFLAAVLTVKALLKFVSNHTYNMFAYYRIAFGGFVLLSMPWIQWAD